MKFYLLCDGQGPRIGADDSFEGAPTFDTLEPLSRSLIAAQEKLRAIDIDDLIGWCDAAATTWTQPQHVMAEFIRRRGLGFLPLWMRRRNLETVCNRALRGKAAALDGFVPLRENDSLLVRAQPRGLVVHWVAGNVPVLGLLSLMQSLLVKNANILKVSQQGAGLLPHLLAAFAGVNYIIPGGKVVRGQDLLDTIAVVYCDRGDDAAAQELSRLADVRVAWGGREAVEAIINLPHRFGTEDIVFGPKLSFAVVGRERLADAVAAQRLAAQLAADASAFDQQGCNSPHTVFVEKGGIVPPTEFAGILGTAMEAELKRNPLAEVDPAAAMNVLGVRTEYAMRGEVWSSRGMGWSVVYSDEDRGLADACYLRTIFVRPVDDICDVVQYASHKTQTAGLAVDDRRHALADRLTARGVDRCPNVGNMRLYDTPWDGLFAMDRLVRWVSTY
jgi:hypothetical protein